MQTSWIVLPSSSENNNNNGSPGDDYCTYHPYACGGLPTPTPAPSLDIPSSEDDGSPLVSIAGVLLLVNLAILDTVLAIGIGAVAITAFTVPGAQLGLVGELILIPLEFISLNLTIYAAQVAATGSTDHDPLPILHAAFPDVLPYKP